ncbi:MAG: hypothetical protein F4X19_09150 [Acidobacteria bacterium]|nr:hypothetical protein [Acidobacteriota bacterium]
MRSRETPVADIEIGHNSVIACHLGNIAQRLGRQIRWDVEKERVIDDPEAEAMTGMNYRLPWKLAL